jgi:hypothetical protein
VLLVEEGRKGGFVQLATFGCCSDRLLGPTEQV